MCVSVNKTDERINKIIYRFIDFQWFHTGKQLVEETNNEQPFNVTFFTSGQEIGGDDILQGTTSPSFHSSHVTSHTFRQCLHPCKYLFDIHDEAWSPQFCSANPACHYYPLNEPKRSNRTTRKNSCHTYDRNSCSNTNVCCETIA